MVGYRQENRDSSKSVIARASKRFGHLLYQEEFEKLLRLFHPVMTFVQDAVNPLPLFVFVHYSDVLSKVKLKVPKEVYDKLEIIAQSLPLSPALQCHPFTGMVFNVSVSTTGHRDTMDLLVCAVFAPGKWESGHLCLDELGLAFDLHLSVVPLASYSSSYTPGGDLTRDK